MQGFSGSHYCITGNTIRLPFQSLQYSESLLTYRLCVFPNSEYRFSCLPILICAVLVVIESDDATMFSWSETLGTEGNSPGS